MKITKLEHSGIAFEKSGETLLCDPVEIQAKLPVFNNVVAIIITHEHGDHFQPEVVARILSQNPNAQIFTTADNSENFPQATIASSGDEFTVGNFRLKFFGKEHDAVLSDFGKQVNNNWLQNFCEKSNIEFHALSLGQHLETTQG